jgi:hypothetical protein
MYPFCPCNDLGEFGLGKTEATVSKKVVLPANGR